MEVDRYLAECNRRLTVFQRLRHLLDLLTILSLFSILPASVLFSKNFSHSFTVLYLAISALTFLAFAYWRADKLKINSTEIAVTIDQALDTKERVLSYDELARESLEGGLENTRDLIKKQLDALARHPDASEIVPFSLTKKQLAQLLVIILALLLSLYLLTLREKRIPLDSVEQLQKLIEEGQLPENVGQQLQQLVDTLQDSGAGSSEIAEQIAASESQIDQAKAEAASQPAAGNEKEQAEAPDQIKPEPTKPPEAPLKQEEKSDQQQEQQKSGGSGGASESDSESEQQEGESEGKENGAESEAEEGEQDSAKAGGSQDQKNDGQGGDQESPQPSSDPKDGAKGESQNQAGDPSQEKEPATEGQKGEQIEQQQAKEPSTDQSGNQAQQKALDQAEKALEQAKEELGMEPSAAPGDQAPQESQQPPDSKQGEAKEESEQKDESDAKGSEGEKKQDDASEPREPQVGQPSKSDGDKPSQEKKDDQSDDKSDFAPDLKSQDQMSEQDAQENPATKSSLSKDDQEIREMKDGEGKEWQGLDEPAGFKDQFIPQQQEQLDLKSATGDGRIITNTDHAKSTTLQTSKQLGRIDSLKESTKQRVPLEYRDIID